ncbi:hypothetical protein SDC9_171081 [bioreactor metagenome]|uniref:Uncharacterized protein n=1 Tax=bioreactor metagenome TaxID=1076179 RepID=A0A645G9X0_9ZZZZ
MFSKDSDPRSVLKIDNKISGKVIRVTANVIDPFWGTQYPATKQDAVRNAQAGIDAALGWDGRSGTIRELVEKGIPVVILTHWQSLFSEGRLTGLTALVELAERVRRVFGPGMEWQSMEELAWSR